ncbi:hypothetical protein GALMADRAFT_242132 [Galerina marginata CBS 339.88]|uniref:AB hydrolase-1 domain-containing protein n=1 Tax=Galerina marginata (strain CBS 339.88) TaxID=685588 RepID=A0A067TA38_GALM3|nr:hypothetical protein GALMADRAFT_242132 [Galerina marginata CBS 339.88]
MPQVKIQSSSGPVLINYTISTPTSEDAQYIDPTLPTVILLHPVFIAHIVFHHQFANPNLRRFNLIGLDARCHGETVGPVPSTFRRTDAADDLFKFMEALRLPPCHLFGMSLGACIGLQTAISYPDKVLSLFMLSPLPLVEPEIVAAGRQEIFDCWVQAHQNPNEPDQEALLDSVFGALQLGFNRAQSDFINALVQYTLPQGYRNWSPEHFEELHTVTVKFSLDRQPHPLPILQRIKCPVHVVHCSEDIAYPLPFAEEIRDRFTEAGLDVRLSQVSGAPQFGCVTHPEEINSLLHDWVMDLADEQVPAARSSVKSPFEADLIKAGYLAHETSDSDDDLVPL